MAAHRAWTVVAILAAAAAVIAQAGDLDGHHHGEDGAYEVRYLPGYDGEMPARHRAGCARATTWRAPRRFRSGAMDVRASR